VDSEANNIVLKLILCMYYLNFGEKSFYIIQLFKTCIYWDGLEDSFRWALIRRLSEFGEKLYYDANIARKFATVPDASCTDEYVDLISARRWIEKKVEEWQTFIVLPRNTIKIYLPA